MSLLNNVMKIRGCCPLCESKNQSTKDILKIDIKFINFIEQYYGEGSFDLLNKYLNNEITYSQCNNCKLIYQKNILSDKGMFELYESLIDPKKSLEKRLSFTIKQNLRELPTFKSL